VNSRPWCWMEYLGVHPALIHYQSHGPLKPSEPN
jgi:hypothetical protein